MIRLIMNSTNMLSKIGKQTSWRPIVMNYRSAATSVAVEIAPQIMDAPETNIVTPLPSQIRVALENVDVTSAVMVNFYYYYA